MSLRPPYRTLTVTITLALLTTVVFIAVNPAAADKPDWTISYDGPVQVMPGRWWSLTLAADESQRVTLSSGDGMRFDAWILEADQYEAYRNGSTFVAFKGLELLNSTGGMLGNFTVGFYDRDALYLVVDNTGAGRAGPVEGLVVNVLAQVRDSSSDCGCLDGGSYDELHTAFNIVTLILFYLSVPVVVIAVIVFVIHMTLKGRREKREASERRAAERMKAMKGGGKRKGRRPEKPDNGGDE